MVQLTCIATRGGDLGNTSLGNGKRVSKNSLRINTIGSVDELNSLIGVAIATEGNALSTELITSLRTDLKALQNDLFDVGADLCMPDQDQAGLRISSHQVHRLDEELERYNAHLNPLKSFVLPGGTALAAQLHVCRTVARHAERHLVALNESEPLNPELLRYFNRLSDVFFVMARVANDKGRLDVLWEPGKHHS
ncbi:MAG: cob(I)yrinic acid a,c-diamide adenosyltransferase [Candidatus Paracaedibacteraceae bacterium]|nr:cob(I)yrinic acid a,c-diamide adenosyltransferase [Candidatus Paracaedibacteraceae bacterium]